jgi:hypothetical protein
MRMEDIKDELTKEMILKNYRELQLCWFFDKKQNVYTATYAQEKVQALSKFDDVYFFLKSNHIDKLAKNRIFFNTIYLIKYDSKFLFNFCSQDATYRDLLVATKYQGSLTDDHFNRILHTKYNLEDQDYKIRAKNHKFIATLGCTNNASNFRTSTLYYLFSRPLVTNHQYNLLSYIIEVIISEYKKMIERDMIFARNINNKDGDLHGVSYNMILKIDSIRAFICKLRAVNKKLFEKKLTTKSLTLLTDFIENEDYYNFLAERSDSFSGVMRQMLFYRGEWSDIMADFKEELKTRKTV